MTTGTELTINATPEQLTELEAVAHECQLQLQNVETPFQASFALAAATRKLDALITDAMMDDILALQGQALGFRTDKDRDKMGNAGPGYPVAVVRPAFIEATVRGFRPINNEFNIIAGRFYGAKAGFERLVKGYPGLTNFEESASVPERSGPKTALVGYVAKWEFKGEEMRYERLQKKLPSGALFDNRIVIRVNEGMIEDAILGKAYRKAYAGILNLLNEHVVIPEGDVDDGVIDVESSAPKVQKSTLFDKEPYDPTDAEPDPSEQTELIELYTQDLAGVENKSQISTIAKRAGGDGGLTDASRKIVVDMCTKRRKEV